MDENNILIDQGDIANCFQYTLSNAEVLTTGKREDVLIFPSLLVRSLT